MTTPSDPHAVGHLERARLVEEIIHKAGRDLGGYVAREAYEAGLHDALDHLTGWSCGVCEHGPNQGDTCDQCGERIGNS